MSKREKKVEKKSKLNNQKNDTELLEKEKNLRRLERIINIFYMEKFCSKNIITPKETDPFI